MKAREYAPAYRLDERPTGDVTDRVERIQALASALAGVDLGAHDKRVIGWLAGWDDDTVRTVVSLMLRLRDLPGGAA